MSKETRVEQARRWVREQRKWIEDHGGTLSAYVARYGRLSDPEHYGDGGEAIYAADMAVLRQYEAELEAALRSQWRRERRAAKRMGRPVTVTVTHRDEEK